MKKILKGLIILPIFIFIVNCDSETNEFTFNDSSLNKLETVSFKETKNYFKTKQNEIELRKKSSDISFLATPDWGTLDQDEIYHTDALLTVADVSINKKGDFNAQLFSLRINGEIKNVIFTIFEKEPESNGKMNAVAFFNDIDGSFLDAYKIENGLFTKKLIPTGKKVSKASFFTFLQAEDEEDDCWNTNCLPSGEGEVDGGQFDEVDLGSVSSSGGSTGDDYGTISYLTFINNSSGDGSNGISSGGGGGSANSGAGTIFGNPVTTEDGVSAEETLNTQVVIDPFVLLEIECNQIRQWQNVAQHTVPTSVVDKIKEIDSRTPQLDWDIQSIEDAGGAVVNMDFFPVTISQFPTNPSTNLPYTPLEFFNNFRQNLTELAAGSNSNVQFSPSTITGFNETQIWNSDNPLGSIISISILENSGSVVCSGYDISNPTFAGEWFFTTLQAPWTSNVDGDGSHPVSGHRQFGYYQDTNGDYVFYVRGVDRFTSYITELIADALSSPDAFEGSDNLWNTFQSNLANFVNNNDGNAIINPDKISRPNWKEVKDVLLGNKPISDLGCN